MKQYDYIVVGAGLYGAVFAREATDAGKKVLVIDRRDRLVDLCEIKYSTHPFKVTLATNDELRRKRWRFAEETKTRRGLRTVLIAAEGVADGSYRGEFHTLVTGDDLFVDV